MPLTVQEIIRKKRDAGELTSEEIDFFIRAVTTKNIEESQIGAMLMAFYLKKLTMRETVNLTRSMIDSGNVLRFENIRKDLLVDKHSTGGVGDKVSLILAPALAACGLKVPMISGRGLLFTGGTLDKLESIPGFQVNLNMKQMSECLLKSGCFICGATENLAPADAILYKLRDLTATVDCASLIVSSILSKKAAEGIGVLVMDIKVGKGSFFQEEEDATNVAQMLMQTGRELGLTVRAVISDMNFPLGQYVGNALEVIESIKCLRNEVDNPVMDLVELLGATILKETGLAKSIEKGKASIRNVIETKMALNIFLKMLTQQGVSESDAADLGAGNFWNVLSKASHVTRLRSPVTGIVIEVDALNIGKACWHLGSGRTRADSRIDHSVGMILLKSVGSRVKENEPWIEVHHSTKNLLPELIDMITSSLVVEPNPQAHVSLVKPRLLN